MPTISNVVSIEGYSNAGGLSDDILFADKAWFTNYAPEETLDNVQNAGFNTYADVATLMADTPAVGTYGFATAESSYWKFDVNSAWVPVIDFMITDTHQFTGSKGFTTIEATPDKNAFEGTGSDEAGVSGIQNEVPFSLEMGGPEALKFRKIYATKYRGVFLIKDPNDSTIYHQFGDACNAAYIVAKNDVSGNKSNEFKGTNYAIIARKRSMYMGTVTMIS